MPTLRKCLTWLSAHLGFMGYFFGLMCVALETLPNEAFAIVGGIRHVKNPVHSIWLIGMIAAVVGVLFHALAYWLDQGRTVLKVYYRTAIVVSLFTGAIFSISIAVCHWSELSPDEIHERISRFIASLWIIPLVIAAFLIGLTAYQYWGIANQPANQIFKLIQKGELQEAMRVGEAISSEKRDFATNHNLAFVYARLGMIAQADMVLNTLKEQAPSQKWLTPESCQHALEQLSIELAKAHETANKL